MFPMLAIAADTNQLLQLAGLLAACFVVMAIAWKRGCFRRHRLADAPPRPIIILWTDVLAMLALSMLGMALAGAAVEAWQVLSGRLAIKVSPTLAIALQTLVTQILAAALPVSFLIWRLARQPQGVIAFGLGPASGQVVRRGMWALALALPMVLALNVLGILIGQWLGYPAPTMGHQLLGLLADADAKLAMIVLGVCVVLIAPAVEEILYRGVLQTFFLHGLAGLGLSSQAARWSAMTLAATAFALAHVSGVPIQVLPALLALGLVLGWLYETTGSLLPAILLHALFNGANLLMAAMVAPPPVG